MIKYPGIHLTGYFRRKDFEISVMRTATNQQTIFFFLNSYCNSVYNIYRLCLLSYFLCIVYCLLVYLTNTFATVAFVSVSLFGFTLNTWTNEKLLIFLNIKVHNNNEKHKNVKYLITYLNPTIKNMIMLGDIGFFFGHIL